MPTLLLSRFCSTNTTYSCIPVFFHSPVPSSSSFLLVVFLARRVNALSSALLFLARALDNLGFQLPTHLLEHTDLNVNVPTTSVELDVHTHTYLQNTESNERGQKWMCSRARKKKKKKNPLEEKKTSTGSSNRIKRELYIDALTNLRRTTRIMAASPPLTIVTHGQLIGAARRLFLARRSRFQWVKRIL